MANAVLSQTSEWMSYAWIAIQMQETLSFLQQNLIS